MAPGGGFFFGACAESLQGRGGASARDLLLYRSLSGCSIYTYIHNYMRTYKRTYVRRYIRTCVHTYIRTYVHTYICT